MYETPLIKFLRNFKVSNNPFTNKSFTITAQETYTNGSDVHLIDNIKIFYTFWDNFPACIISYHNDKIVSVSYIVTVLLLNEYAYFPEAKISLNGVKMLVNTQDPIDFFKILYNAHSLSYTSKNELKILFENTWEGIQIFEYNKTLLFYIINEEHEDDYFFNKELLRWKK